MVSSLSRQLGEMQGKLDVRQMIGVVEGWQHKCAMLTMRLRSMCEAMEPPLDEIEAILGGEYADQYQSLYDKIEAARAELDAAKKELDNGH